MVFESTHHLGNEIFSTSHTLGGHQKAHKAEHALEKQRKQRYDFGSRYLLFNSYFSYPNTHFTSSYYRALSVTMESMIQKTSNIFLRKKKHLILTLMKGKMRTRIKRNVASLMVYWF